MSRHNSSYEPFDPLALPARYHIEQLEREMARCHRVRLGRSGGAAATPRTMRLSRRLVVGVSLVTLALGLLGVSSAGARTTVHNGSRHQVSQTQSGAITIETWLLANPDKNGLSGAVTACFKLKGAFVDQGGEPNWTDSTYADTTATSPANKCGDWQPVGGFVFVPGMKATTTSIYAVHTLTGQKGQIFITFTGTYNLTNQGSDASQGSGAWVITGGTRAYSGIQGVGTWAADASHFPYARHMETGTLYRVSPH